MAPTIVVIVTFFIEILAISKVAICNFTIFTGIVVTLNIAAITLLTHEAHVFLEANQWRYQDQNLVMSSFYNDLYCTQ